MTLGVLLTTKGVLLAADMAQVGTHADVAHSIGLLDDQQRDQARTMQQQVQQLIADGEWQPMSII